MTVQADKVKDLISALDPSVWSKPSNALLSLFDNFKVNLNVCVPAIVTKVNEDKTRMVTVQPIPNRKFRTESGLVDIKRGEVTVPCMTFIHGGYILSSPLFVGDTGWLIAGDRDAIEALKENSTIPQKDKSDNKGPQSIESYSVNEFDFGFFIPDSWAELPETYEKLKDNFTIGNVTTDDDTTCYLTIDKKGECRIHAQKIDFIFNQRGLTIDGTQHDVFIDPDSDLTSSDARFREVSIIKDIETREGTTYIKHQKARVLVDDGDEIEEIPISGGVVDIDVGNTTTGEPGTNASVEKRLEEGKVILDFTIPKGSQGENGAPAGFGTPTATALTLPSGSPATAEVTADGSDTAKVFHFTFGIPKGEKGDGGETVGYNGEVKVAQGIFWDESDYRIKTKYVILTVANGLITNVSDEMVDDVNFIETTPYSSESTGG